MDITNKNNKHYMRISLLIVIIIISYIISIITISFKITNNLFENNNNKIESFLFCFPFIFTFTLYLSSMVCYNIFYIILWFLLICSKIDDKKCNKLLDEYISYGEYWYLTIPNKYINEMILILEE